MSKKYDVYHDAFYDSESNEWLEGKCSDPDCVFCKDRPSKHGDEKEVENAGD